MSAQQSGKMGGGSGMLSGTLRELSAEFAAGALKSVGMLRCSKEATTRGSDRKGMRSCVQKGQRSPQEWTDRARCS